MALEKKIQNEIYNKNKKNDGLYVINAFQELSLQMQTIIIRF